MSSAALPVLCACQRLEVAAHTIRMPASATLSTGTLYSSQKSLIFFSKEPYILLKRALYSSQKSLIFFSKEPYILIESALYSFQKAFNYDGKANCMYTSMDK